MAQEENADASKFVVYEHEFKLRDTRLNNGGEDHIKEIASRIACGSEFPVIIERSSTNDRQGDYNYPVNVDPELDMQRRAIIVAALQRQGVADADQRVVVATALAPGYSSAEAERAYLRGTRVGSSAGTFGGGLGGLGGFGGAGNFGGGGFF